MLINMCESSATSSIAELSSRKTLENSVKLSLMSRKNFKSGWQVMRMRVMIVVSQEFDRALLKPEDWIWTADAQREATR